RDLKPANVTLIERGGHPYFCKIVDFGIAKCATSDTSRQLTHVGTLLGTPHYMAPEQVEGEVDARTDIYGLGGVLYHMATGVPPFEAENVLGILLKHKTETPRPIHTHPVAPHFPRELEAVILRCLEKRPDHRYASALDLVEALQSA
ncbi:MAG: serine/threonine protein kinase, partial [Deltaproteobacteria bacterium]|nr:serine/threonine protein kinase [Deltaproteobacteria bacterium]